MANTPKTIVDYSNLINSKFAKSKNIASVEATITATEAHAVGTQLIYNNTLYTVTAPIAIGDMLVEGTNITASDNITEQIADVVSDVAGIKTEIAPEENGSTSSAAYSVGEYISRNGVFYEVIDAIAIGDAFVVDSNISATSVSEELTDVNSDIGQIRTDLPNKLDIENQQILGAWNLNKYPYVSTTMTRSGVTFTDLGDGRIKASTNGGTSSGFGQFPFWDTSNPLSLVAGKKYYLSGAPVSGTTTDKVQLFIAFEDANNANRITVICPENGEVEFTMPVGYHFHWFSYTVVESGVSLNDVIVSPQISTQPRKVFSPYAMTNKELTDKKLDITDEQILGAWNECKVTSSTTTVDGTVFTVNADGSVTVVSPANHSQALFDLNIDYLPNHSFYLSGCPSGGSASTYEFQLNNYAGSVFSNQGGYTFVDKANIVSNTTYRYRIVIRASQNPVNVTFYPMFSVEKAPYVPYAMTNRELTDAIIPSGYMTTGLSSTQFTIIGGGYHKMGRLCIVCMRIKATATATAPSISGFPAYNGVIPNDNIVGVRAICIGGSDTNAYMQRTGNLVIDSVVANSDYEVNMMYICNA